MNKEIRMLMRALANECERQGLTLVAAVDLGSNNLFATSGSPRETLGLSSDLGEYVIEQVQQPAGDEGKHSQPCPDYHGGISHPRVF